MNKNIKNYDVIIVGAGSVGLTMGAVLAKFGLEMKIAILDRKAFEVPLDSRSSALAAGVTQIFEVLGIWQDMLPTSCPIKVMKITDSGKSDISRPVFLSIEGDVAPNRPYAHMVPNTTTIRYLLKAVKDGVDLIAPVEIKSLQSGGKYSRLVLADGIILQAPLVIGADGARSSMRDMAKIGVMGHDYGQSGVVTTISHEKPHENTAYEHFRPNGPFASLPLPNNCSSLVWSEKTKQAEIYRDMEHDKLEREIEKVMGHCLGKVKIEEKVQAFPLKLQVAKKFIAPRFALIGDAAHFMHPITGQGMNLGLKDVAILAEVIIEAMRLGQDFGASDVLEKYQKQRKSDVVMMAMATEGLNRLFSNDIAPLRAMRDIGLGMVDRLPIVKKSLIRHAAGVGDVPRLMKGLPI